MIIELDLKIWKKEIIRHVKRHSYTRSCPAVIQFAYGIVRNGKLLAVSVYTPSPSRSIMKNFVKDPIYFKHYLWHSRLCSAGISSKELDELIQFANSSLRDKNYFWIESHCDPRSYIIDSPMRLVSKGFVGEVYRRNGAEYLGTTKGGSISHFIVDGKPFHARQGRQTLTRKNVRERFPNASIRVIKGHQKQRWAWVLGNTEHEIAERKKLIAYEIQAYVNLRQPRLLSTISQSLKLILSSTWRFQIYRAIAINSNAIVQKVGNCFCNSSNLCN